MVHKLNLGSTRNILEAVRQCGLGRVVYASSLAVYGKTPLDELVTEEAPLAPVSLYGASKVYCEQLGNAYKSEFGIDFVAVRLPAMWGPGKNQLAGKSSLTGSGRFSEIVEKPAKGEPVTVTASNQRYDLLFTKDAGQLIRRLLSAKQLQYTAYNAGSGTFVTLQEIAEELKKYLPQSEITFEEGYDFFAIPCQGPLSTERAVRELGYQPIYQLGEAVRDYLSALRGQGPPYV